MNVVRILGWTRIREITKKFSHAWDQLEGRKMSYQLLASSLRLMWNFFKRQVNYEEGVDNTVDELGLHWSIIYNFFGIFDVHMRCS